MELDDDWLRQMVQNFTQAVIELEVEQKVGAAPHERSPNRLTQRNGYRELGLATRVGELELRIPPSSGPAISSRACCNRAGERKKRWWR